MERGGGQHIIFSIHHYSNSSYELFGENEKKGAFHNCVVSEPLRKVKSGNTVIALRSTFSHNSVNFQASLSIMIAKMHV